ncbi:alpha/beta hydrolase [Falsihalocynthiibacter sp. SS001]|uniref:alpha/beta hydrolase n=1 Tax=Falsihalocynthiibacter sp. SS001 TaxID=3349698 RepID=UPI0036D29DE8
MKSAPFYEDIIGAADPGETSWWVTSDDVRIRLGVWNSDAPMGTVLLFPGRTEYIEKYAPTATFLDARGFATLVVDWRGQGLSDRDNHNPLVGHVATFEAFQHDVDTVMRAAAEMNLPKPYYLLGHSMGGCIGLRALMSGLDVKAASFTGPMWGINIPAHKRHAAWTVSALAHKFGRGKNLTPSTSENTYVLAEPFNNNMLTTDKASFEWMRHQVMTHPDLALGGPSYSWLFQALRECKSLARLPSPHVPCLTFLGTDERIVVQEAVKTRMQKWPDGELIMVSGAEHEILMENPKTLEHVRDRLTEFFAAHA